MFTKITRIQPLDFLSVAEAKDHLNIIDNNDDDNHIRILVDAAMELVEKGTNRLLSLSTVNAELSYRTNKVLLPYGEIEVITTCQVNDIDLEYKFSSISQRILLTGTPETDDDVIITYDAGYSKVPRPLKSAAMMIVSNLYEYREDDIDLSLQNAPLASVTLMNAYKIPLGAL